MHRINDKILGILVILVGFGYLGNALDWWNFTIFFDGWWAVLIMLLCIFNFIKNGIGLFNIACFLISLYFFLDLQGFIDFDLSLPLVLSVGLIIFGINMLLPVKNRLK